MTCASIRAFVCGHQTAACSYKRYMIKDAKTMSSPGQDWSFCWSVYPRPRFSFLSNKRALMRRSLGSSCSPNHRNVGCQRTTWDHLLHSAALKQDRIETEEYRTVQGLCVLQQMSLTSKWALPCLTMLMIRQLPTSITELFLLENLARFLLYPTYCGHKRQPAMKSFVNNVLDVQRCIFFPFLSLFFYFFFS